MSAASPVLVRLDRWLLGAPDRRMAQLAVVDAGVPRRVLVTLFDGDSVAAQCTAVLGETALTRALDIAEEQS